MVRRWTLCFAALVSAPADAQSPPAEGTRPGLVVLPFTVASRAADTTTLRQSADRVVEHLNRVLRADTGIRWLEYQPMRRPRDPRTGLTTGARYGVLGTVRAGRGDSAWVRFELVSIESVTRIMRDSVQTRIGDESAQVPPMALRLLAALREAERGPLAASPVKDSVPVEAVALYTRALVRANRSDTAAAVQLLRMALTIAPRYGEACEALRRLRPGESCP